jgi:hypothetical protein
MANYRLEKVREVCKEKMKDDNNLGFEVPVNHIWQHIYEEHYYKNYS